MPKVVDRDERKGVIVEAAWRIIAERGIDGVTMRDLASETGYANGALARYFSGKDEILELAYKRIVAATDRRIDASVGAARGVKAVHAMCAEILPLTEETRLEGRIAIALWQRAMTKRAIGAPDDDVVARWTVQLGRHLADAIEGGELVPVDADTYAALLMHTMIGLQVSTMLRDRPSPDEQRSLLDAVLTPIRR